MNNDLTQPHQHRLSPVFMVLLTTASLTTAMTEVHAIPTQLNSISGTLTKNCQSQRLELTSSGQLKIQGLDCIDQLNPKPSGNTNLALSGNGATLNCRFGGLTLNRNGNVSVSTQENCLQGAPSANTNTPKGVETSRVSLNHTPTSINISDPLNEKVVLAGVPSMNGGQAGVVRLFRQNDGSISSYFNEWHYLDGFHLTEQVDYLALDQGCHEINNQTRYAVGSFTHSIPAGSELYGDWAWLPVSFPSQCFDDLAANERPKVFATIQSYQNTQDEPVVVRLRQVKQSGFQAALFQTKAFNRDSIGHAQVTIGYVAILGDDSGNLDLDGASVPYSASALLNVTASGQDSDWKTVSGTAPVKQIKIQEDKSINTDIAHGLGETIDVLVIGDNQVFAQPVTYHGRDSFVLRARNKPQ